MTVHLRDKIETLTHREPLCVEPGATLRSVARTMWAEDVGALVVGDPRHPIGVISERDVVAELGQGADPDAKTAEQAMTKYVISARLGDRLFDAASEMVDDGIRHLPVVDDKGDVVGMISARDLLRPLLLDALGG
jgi:CBS domain-containing protein